MDLIENIGNILIILIAIASVILIILIALEKNLYQKIVIRKNRRNAFYIKEIKKINKKDPKIALNKIDNIARNFFKEAFKIGKSKDYTEIKGYFNQKNNIDASILCDMMIKILYSGKEPDVKKNQILIIQLIKIIVNNPIMTKEEKLLQENKNKKTIKNLLQNIWISKIRKKELDNKKN